MDRFDLFLSAMHLYTSLLMINGASTNQYFITTESGFKQLKDFSIYLNKNDVYERTKPITFYNLQKSNPTFNYAGFTFNIKIN